MGKSENPIESLKIDATRLDEAYRTTNYWVDDAPCGPFAMRCFEHFPGLDDLLQSIGCMDWFYITPCNPGSQIVAESENAARLQTLERRLTAMKARFYHGRGVGTTTPAWPPEPSFLVCGVDRDVGIAWGREFGQLAILAGRFGKPVELICIDSLRPKSTEPALAPAL